MLYKDDWEKAKIRMRAWWAGELIDRAVIQVSAPRKGVKVRLEWDGWSLIHNLTHPEKSFLEFEEYCKATYFGGEAFPNLWINLGPGITAAYLGCSPHIAENTVWFEARKEKSWRDILTLRLNPANKWWKTTRELTRQALDYAAERFFVGITDLNSILNILGSLRGTQQLLIDLLDHPQEVKEATVRIMDIWFHCYEELLRITQRHVEGCSTCMGIWFPERGSDVQCDFAAMLSPHMFEELVVPHLQQQCRQLKHAFYHLDGPGQLAHIDLLLDIPELCGIQWVPGAGRPGVGSPKWFPLYKRIQKKGKLLILQGMAKEDIGGVMREMSSRGLLISTQCDSQEEARELLGKVKDWTR